MKKIDILNFITDFRKSPNQTRTYQELLDHLGVQHETAMKAMLAEMKQLGVIRETEADGQKVYQVAKK